MQRPVTEIFHLMGLACPAPVVGRDEAGGARRAQVNAELVRLLYAQAPLGITTTLVVAALVAFAHQDVVNTPVVVGWFLGHVLVNVLRLLLIQAYGSDLQSKIKPQTWGSWYTFTSAGSGLAWGSAALLVAFSQSPSHQYFVAFVVGGMVSGALAVLSPLMKAYTAFSVLALLPVASWFLLQGDQIYFLMGLLGVLLLAVMLLTAKRLNANLIRSLGLSFANAELADTVSTAWDETVRINRELEREVSARRQIEAWLKREKDRAQTTLQSLGDAVITTDASCRIDYMNPAAERLTGWSLRDGHHRPLEEIFQLKDSGAHTQGRTDPVRRCLSEAVSQGSGDGTLRRKDNAELPVQHSWGPIRNAAGELSGSVLVFRDQGNRPLASVDASCEYSNDSLTGLTNRRGFERRLARAAGTAESENRKHVLLCLRLSGYETIKDRQGTKASEELLKRFAGQLQSQVRESDTIGHLTPDRFGILLEGCSTESAQLIVENLKLAIAGFRFVWAGEKLALTPEIHTTAVSASTKLDDLIDC